MQGDMIETIDTIASSSQNWYQGNIVGKTLVMLKFAKLDFQANDCLHRLVPSLY